MNISSALPDYLSNSQSDAISSVFTDFEVLPLSCLFWHADIPVLIAAKRIIPDDMIYIPKSVSLVCTVGDETRTLDPGEFLMVAAGRPHGVTVVGGGPSQQFAMHMHLLDGAGHRIFNRLSSPFGAMPDPDQWFNQLAICTHLMGRRDGNGEAYFETMIKSMLCEQFSLGAVLQELPQRMHPRITPLISEIREHCAQPWTVTAMADRCHMSVSSFRKHFGTSTGVSPKKFVQRVRLTHARSILATRPDLSVEEVANQVGVRDAHYFHAIYKDMFGETPKQPKAKI